jgi:glutamyl-tRNA reductase
MTGARCELDAPGEDFEVDADAVAGDLVEHAVSHRDRELERAFDRLAANEGLTEDDRRVLEALADSLIYHLVAPPAESVASMDDPADIDAARTLFDLDS